jgi:ATPase family AAA domain-containing protein 3A/B
VRPPPRSGGDVAPLGSDGVTQIHQLFDWAKQSRRGLLLFIDEAEAFLGQRGPGMSEHQRNALNAMLFHTGSQSKNFVLVLATNRPADLDRAVCMHLSLSVLASVSTRPAAGCMAPQVIDRVDEMVEFPLPNLAERRLLAELYCAGPPRVAPSAFPTVGNRCRVRGALARRCAARALS